MKKVLFDVRELERGKKTGISRFIVSILSNYHRFNNIEFILIRDRNTDLDYYNFDCFKSFIISDFPFYSEQVEILNIIRKIKPDIYFSPYYKYPIFSDAFNITCVFDLTYLLIEPYKNSLKNIFYMKNFLKLFTKKSDLIITSSQNSLKDMINLLNFSRDKIKVVYLPLSEIFYRRKENQIEQIKSKYGIDKHFILYVGNNMPHKNVRLLYDSYISLPYDIKKDYQLVMIGFKDIFNSYPLARVIEKVDDDDELACFYSGASLFVFPSLYEGFGYPPLEALKCGAKVVSSNLSCLPEILKDYVFYFNPYNRSELIDLMIQVLNGDIKIEKKPDFSLFSIDCFISEVKKIFGLI